MTPISKLTTRRSVFQSTHPYRVWPNFFVSSIIFELFQSTHPYRVWRLPSKLCSAVGSFNPHTHTGCDVTYAVYKLATAVSIHTPIQGVTQFGWIWGFSIQFQSTHPYRVWPPHSHLIFQRQSFNPHTHTGCDLFLYLIICFIVCFNPHTHTGCDSLSVHLLFGLLKFQSTHPYRVWQPVRKLASV